MFKRSGSWIKDHIPTKRRLIQLYSALLYNAHLKGFITGEIYKGKLKAVCVPGFNCYSCPGAIGACPLGSLQASLSSSGHQAGFYIIGIFLLYGLIAGRTICGYLCPLGLIQELLHKIPTPKIKKSAATRALTWLKYVILAVFVFGVTLWYGLMHGMAIPAFCKYICPAGTFEGAMMLLSNSNNSGYFGMLGILFTRKFIIMLIIGLLCVFCYRSFCRFLCPLGALYGMFNRLSLIGVKVDVSRCNGCGACVRNCKMDVRRVGDHECIHCGQCIDNCAQSALSLKAGNFTLKAPKKGLPEDTSESAAKRKKVEKTVWTLAILLLTAVLLWVNILDPSGKKKSKSETSADNKAVTEQSDKTGDAPFGYNVGEQLEDFTAKCFDGSTFRLADQKGKVVVINLWATWCGPCVQELPLFNEFYDRHGDDAAVIACHSKLVTDDVEKFLSDKGWDMPFTVDDEENGIFEKTNGSGVLPQTIVLNRKGEVIYNEIRSVTSEMLEQLYEQAAGGETDDAE
nr:redoxin family protein [Lachnospiraceae bacterium]